MATKNAIFCANPTEIECGGTGKQSFTTYAVITGGTTSTGALQSIASVGTDGQVLTSNGAAALPTFQTSSATTDIAPTVTATAPTTDGEIFYDTATDTFVGYGLNLGTWTAKNAMNTARYTLSGCGTSTSALSFGGYVGGNSAVTEQWDGTNWTAKNNLNTARQSIAGCGTSSAALSFGGYVAANSAVTEQWDGTNWTAKNNLNTARPNLAGAGITSDALSFAGGGPSAVTERFDGTNWTAKTSMNTARSSVAGIGTAEDALSVAGYIAAVSAVTERYSGTGNTWTVKASINTAVNAPAGSGTADFAYIFGGDTTGGGAYTGITERYDSGANSWTTVTAMNTSRGALGGSGTSSAAALSFGGYTGAVSAVTEQYAATVQEVTFTTT